VSGTARARVLVQKSFANDSGPIRVRFHGVDAPEKAQPHGKEATTALSAWVLNKDVQLEPFEHDRYDRLVAIVYEGDRNVNAEMVRAGHAWAFRRYMRKEDASLCEDEAAPVQRNAVCGRSRGMISSRRGSGVHGKSGSCSPITVTRPWRIASP
jgi:endonuclease YncB( thermonuclease family)